MIWERPAGRSAPLCWWEGFSDPSLKFSLSRVLAFWWGLQFSFAVTHGANLWVLVQLSGGQLPTNTQDSNCPDSAPRPLRVATGHLCNCSGCQFLPLCVCVCPGHFPYWFLWIGSAFQGSSVGFFPASSRGFRLSSLPHCKKPAWLPSASFDSASLKFFWIRVTSGMCNE